MKRSLSLVLALVMILGSFSSVFAATVPTTATDKAAFLAEEGILKGNLEGELNLTQDLKRRDALVILSRLFDVEEEAKATSADELVFTDLTDAYYNGFIAWAVEEGYAIGKTDTTFDPNGPLTTQAFATMLLRALGYEENGADVFKEAYKIATDLGILEDVELEEKATVTRGDMAAMTYNALGVVVKGTKETLAEKLGIEMPELPVTDLTAKVKDTVNLKEIELELSSAKLADKDKLENVNNYKLENVNNYKLADNKIVKAELNGDVVTILLEDALRVDREYKLRVRSIHRDIDKEYTFKAKDNTIPSVEEVVFAQKHGIRITASEPVQLKDDVRGRNFIVDGKNIAMNVEIYGREIVLTPYRSETFPTTAEKIIIAGLEDFAGFRSASEEVEIEMVEDKEGPKVEDLILRGYNQVEAIFDKDVYIDSVGHYRDRNNVGNISYLAGRTPVYADKAEKIDTNKVLYTFNEEVYKELLRERTRFDIDGLKNHSGVEMEKVTDMVAREILDNVEPEVMKYTIETRNVDAGTATIRVHFDKNVDGVLETGSKTQLVVKEHFRLYERDVLPRNAVNDNIVSASYVLDSKGEVIKDLVDVTFKDLKEWKPRNSSTGNVRDHELNYVLETENFTDVTSKRNKMYRDYHDFKLTRLADFGVVENGVKVDDSRANETHIAITFTKPVDRNSAENLGNYIFNHTDGVTRRDVKDLKGRIVTEKDGFEVTIILPDFDVKKYDTLRILETLKNKDDERLDQEYEYNFRAGLITNNAQYTVWYDKANDQFDVNARPGIEKVTLETNASERFVIRNNGDLKEVTIDAPNAHVEVPASVVLDKVTVKSIGRYSLEINGTVTNLVISTTDTVRVYGDNIKDTRISSTVTEAKVILAQTGNAVVTIKKGHPIVVLDNLGNTDIADLQEGAKAELEDVLVAVTTGSGIELEVAVADRADEAKVTKVLQAKLQAIVSEGYKVVVSKLSIVGENAKAVFTVTETENTDNTAEDIETFTIKFKEPAVK